MATLEFFFDYASPWSYMAFCRVEALAAEAGAELVWRPVHMGEVFRRANPGVAAMRAHPVPAKVTHYYKDMRDWARRLGITIGRPPVYGGGSKQLESSLALRGGVLALQRGLISPYTRSVYEAYWHDLEDVSDPNVLARCAARAGLDVSDWPGRLDDPALARCVDANVDDLIRRGGFGVPTFFVDRDDMYFGNDRMEFVRDALSERA